MTLGNEKFPRFVDTLKSLGNPDEVAKMMGVSTKTIERLSQGKVPTPTRKMLPELLRSLADDLEAQTVNTH